MSDDNQFLTASDRSPSRNMSVNSKRSTVEQVQEYRAVNYSCLCNVFHVKRGAMIVAGLELVRSAVIVAVTIWLDENPSPQFVMPVFLFVLNLIVSVLLCVTASALIYGLQSKNRYWMIGHMIAQPCAFVYLFVVAVYMLAGAGKGKGTSLYWILGFLAAVAAGAELWFSVVVFRAYKFLRDLAMDAREKLMARAYFSAVRQLLQLPMAPDVNVNTQDFVNRLQRENVELWMGQEMQTTCCNANIVP